MERGRYYLGRVVKLGNLDQSRLMDAILDAPTITIRKFRWTITDTVDRRDSKMPFVFGRLSKFHQEGHVTIVDTDSKSQIDAIARNLLAASSPFVYLPEYSGIAYLHVWNGIQQDVFPRRFKALIEAAYDDFFVDCTIEAIADYQTFVSKLRSIEVFHDIQATVRPPNPLFGRLWGSLREYIERRNADEVRVREIAEEAPGIATNLVALMTGLLRNPDFEPASVPDITDAALLMAADGYGQGKVTGMRRDREEVLIRTSDTHRSFLDAKEPNPDALAEHAHRQLKSVSTERDMHHPQDEEPS
ncbi:MAG: hypothetical protein H7A55_23930 [Verrucomicrobiaceae bacterium]|nr:hypothetical protein [Verrucomicrobiaceae bacterium]